MKKKQEFISLKEVKLLIEACKGMSKGLIDAAFIAVAYGTSLKLDDILDLRVTDYDNGYISCRGVKIKMIGGLEEYLERWIVHRLSYRNVKGCLMFCCLRGKYAGSSSNEFRHDFPKISKISGVNKRINTLSLRDSSILYRFLINKEDLDYLTMIGRYSNKACLSRKIKEMISDLKGCNSLELSL